MRFILDENLPPRLAAALELLGEPVEAAGKATPRGAPDDELVRHVADLGGCLVSRDKRMLRSPSTVAALREARVGLFVLMDRQVSTLELARVLLWAWPEVRRWAERTEAPFFLEITPRGEVREIRVGR